MFRQHEHRIRWCAVGAAILLALWYAHARFEGNDIFSPSSPAKLIAGEATAPFQYRALAPWLAGLLQDTGLPAFASISLLFKLLEFAAVFLAYLAFDCMLARHFTHRATRAVLALSLFYALYFVLCSPNRANAYYFPWDTLSVAFFTAGLATLQRKNWWLFYPLFILGTFNRETTCFLTIVYLLVYFGKEPNRRLVLHIAAQFVLWVSVKVLLGWIFADATLYTGKAGFFDMHLMRNVHFLANPLSYLYFLHVMGALWLVVAVCYDLVDDHFLRRALWVVVPFFAGMFLVGLLGEVRIFAELTPLITAAFLLIMRRLTQAASSAPPALDKRALPEATLSSST